MPEGYRKIAPERLKYVMVPPLGNLNDTYDMMSVKIVNEEGELTNFWDYGAANEFEWVPQDDGIYNITVNGRTEDGNIETRSVTTTIRPSTGATVSTNPLVLHYGVQTGSCNMTTPVWARFRQAGVPNSKWVETPARPCRGENHNTNFLLGGMYETTRYEIQHKVGEDGEWSTSTMGKTAEIDVDIPFNYRNVQGLPKSNTEEGIIIHHHLFTLPLAGHVVGGSTATDMDGKLLWYYKTSWADHTKIPVFMFFTPSFQESDRFIAHHGEPDPRSPYNPMQIMMQKTLRVYDMAGNTITRCTVDEVNKQLTEMGKQPIYQFHHDSMIKEDGNIISIIGNERIYEDYPGLEGKKVGLLIDGFIELTTECEVVYSWSWIDHIDPLTSLPKQDPRCETIAPATSSCGSPSIWDETKTEEDPNGILIDWSHANAIQYIPEDGSIILDSRNQNNVLKINYARGKGDGKIIWELGKDGDFEIIKAFEDDEHPWFSAQHSPRLYNNKDLLIFDNSNQRVLPGLEGPQTGKNSRGQVFQLDQKNMIANQTMSAELDGFSYYLGSAQRLENGEAWFLSGFIIPAIEELDPDLSGPQILADVLMDPQGLQSHSYQFDDSTPAGELQYKMVEDAVFSYRSYKMKNMWEQETPLDFNVCCIDSDCGEGRTCSCTCDEVTNIDGEDSRHDERKTNRKNKDKKNKGLRRLLFGGAGDSSSSYEYESDDDSNSYDDTPSPSKCGCVGFMP
jgi:hypothetical protein